MLVFSHIPRTGGTSLRNFVARGVDHALSLDALSDLAFRRDAELLDYDFIATHCGHAIFERLPEARRVTILRDPVERIVSMYHHLRERGDDVSSASQFARSLSLRDFVSLTNPAVTVAVENAQVWHLLHDKNLVFRNRFSAKSDHQKVDAALNNLSTYDIVGFHDRLDETFTKVADVIGIADTQYPRLASSKRPALSELHREDLDAIRSKVALDDMLFVEAKRRFG